MRSVTILFSVAAVLAPLCGSADSVQAQAAATAQTSSTTMPMAAVTARAPAAETVTVTARAPAAEARPASDPDEIVCLMTPPRTGSRIGGSRDCRSRREWDRQRKYSQTILSGIQMRGLQGPTLSTDIRPGMAVGH